ncbi:MAG TPA: phytoene/squalene synthase family protein [Desulfobacteraceae bacterium]|nr:phytoene/squalene synthase family protein [Desulfobacteraceae bacterium]HPQ27016.1 phytoene/squalene synthase family protein [Desulfobacteraceae bacterium]
MTHNYHFPIIHKINYPAAEQWGIVKSIERPKGRGLVCLRQDRTLVRLWRIEKISFLEESPAGYKMEQQDINPVNDQQYQDNILMGVSRTFALTIPQLPPDLSRVVGNGYLLCRIVDTVEDEPALTPDQKRHFSQEFVRVVAGNASAYEFSNSLFSALSSSTTDEEKDLIKNVPAVIRITRSFSGIQQAALLRCVQIMAEGMADFQQNGSPFGLKDMEEMDRYCYHVAGVVGEMLTTLFCDYSPRIARKQSQLESLAVSFGQALQMTNILKDIWDDRARGACWLPQDIFLKSGFNLKDLSSSDYDPAFGEGIAGLLSISYVHLKNALSYILLIPRNEQGIRRFCLWALGMAILTLRRINRYRNFSESRHVKISRRNVKATIFTCNITAFSNLSLRMLFYFLTRSLLKSQ